MTTGFLAALRQAETSDAAALVIEAIPADDQDGADANFWWVHENEWPRTAHLQLAAPTIH